MGIKKLSKKCSIFSNFCNMAIDGIEWSVTKKCQLENNSVLFKAHLKKSKKYKN